MVTNQVSPLYAWYIVFRSDNVAAMCVFFIFYSLFVDGKCNYGSVRKASELTLFTKIQRI